LIQFDLPRQFRSIGIILHFLIKTHNDECRANIPAAPPTGYYI
jgi:hypothetical protein